MSDITKFKVGNDTYNIKDEESRNTSPTTVTGNPATFSDGIDLPARNVTVTIEPSQEGTGDPSPTNVRPLIGLDAVDVDVCGKNILGGSVLLKNAQDYIPAGVTDTTIKTFSFGAGAAVVAGLSFSSDIKFKENTAYTIILTLSKSNSTDATNVRVRYTNGTYSDLKLDFPVTANTKYTKAFVTSENKTIKEISKENVSGVTDLYYDECGVFEGANANFEPYNPNSKTTTVQLGRTVYGGVLDVTNGKLTITHGFSDLKTADWSYSDGIFSTDLGDSKTYQPGNLPNMFCSVCPSGIYSIRRSYSTITAFMVDTLREFQIRYSGYTSVEDFVAFLTSNNAQLAYELATPEVIDLTPTEIDMLLGYNTISTNGTTLSLIYQPNNVLGVAEKYTDDKVKELSDSVIDELKAYIGYTEDDIYGVEVDMVNKKFTRLAGAVGKTAGIDFDNIEPWKRRRCNVTDAGVVVAYYGDEGYSETGALTQAVTVGDVTYEVGTAVQVMVEQPKFYYKVVPLLTEKREGEQGVHMRKGRYYVSGTKKAGFKVHPAFIRNGVEMDKIYLSAYEGSTYDVSASAYNTNDAHTVDFTASTGDKLASIAGAKPTSGISQSGATRAGFRKLAANRGSGWTQATIQSATATELLFLIEYASMNMQSKLGVGVTNKTDDGSTNMSELTGVTTGLGNATGVAVSTGGWTVVSYRGEENFFGNIWKWIDGINIYNYGEGSVYIADHTFADNSKTGSYQDAHITVCGANGYVSAFAYNEDFDWLFIASEVENGANSAAPVGDYFYQNKTTSAYTVATLGGSWAHGSKAGSFYWGVDSASSYRTRGVGGRLLYAPASAE